VRTAYWWTHILTSAERERFNVLRRHDELKARKQREASHPLPGDQARG